MALLQHQFFSAVCWPLGNLHGTLAALHSLKKLQLKPCLTPLICLHTHKDRQNSNRSKVYWLLLSYAHHFMPVISFSLSIFHSACLLAHLSFTSCADHVKASHAEGMSVDAFAKAADQTISCSTRTLTTHQHSHNF